MGNLCRFIFCLGKKKAPEENNQKTDIELPLISQTLTPINTVNNDKESTNFKTSPSNQNIILNGQDSAKTKQNNDSSSSQSQVENKNQLLSKTINNNNENSEQQQQQNPHLNDLQQNGLEHNKDPVSPNNNKDNVEKTLQKSASQIKTYNFSSSNKQLGLIQKHSQLNLMKHLNRNTGPLNKNESNSSLFFADMDNDFSNDYYHQFKSNNNNNDSEQQDKNFIMYKQWIEKMDAFYQQIIINERDQNQIEEIYQQYLSAYQGNYDLENQKHYYPLITEKFINLSYRSDLHGLTNERTFMVKGYMYIKCIDWEDLVNECNKISLLKSAFKVNQIYKINNDEHNLIIYSNVVHQKFQNPIDFLYFKQFQIINSDNKTIIEEDEKNDDNNNNNNNNSSNIQNSEKIIEIDVSITYEELEEAIEPLKKIKSVRGNILRGKVYTKQKFENEDYTKIEIFNEIIYGNSNITTVSGSELLKEQFLSYFNQLSKKYNTDNNIYNIK